MPRLPRQKSESGIYHMDRWGRTFSVNFSRDDMVNTDYPQILQRGKMLFPRCFFVHIKNLNRENGNKDNTKGVNWSKNYLLCYILTDFVEPIVNDDSLI